MYILAIDIGGTHTKIALVDERGNTNHLVSIPTCGKNGAGLFLESVLGTARKVIDRCEDEKVEGVGIGIAGFIDPDHTRLQFNPNIPWLEGVELKNYFTKELNLPVNIEVDSNAAALAEAVHGGGKNSQRLLVFSIGTGLGGGMVIDGQILRIANECLGDIGHVIVAPGGPQCTSGCHGCAEAMVSVAALERYMDDLLKETQEPVNFMVENKGKIISASEIIKAAKQSDQVSIKAIEKLGSYLGIALASVVPVFAPDRICIAGGISEAGASLLDATIASFQEIAGLPYAEGVIIQKAVLGWQSVLVGAAEAFRQGRK